jgi:hypothetical protein
VLYILTDMDADSALDPLVLEAVREKLARLEGDLSAKEQEFAKAQAAMLNAQAARDQVKAARDKLAKYLADNAPKVPDSVLEGASVTMRTWATFAAGAAPKILAPRSLRQQIIGAVKDALREGVRMRSEEIYEYLIVAGFKLPFENGPRRITQILSESGQFDPDRTNGWGLKAAAPTASEESP